MLGRKRSQPIRLRLRDRQPITCRLESISFESHLSEQKQEQIFMICFRVIFKLIASVKSTIKIFGNASESF